MNLKLPKFKIIRCFNPSEGEEIRVVILVSKFSELNFCTKSKIQRNMLNQSRVIKNVLEKK